MYIRRFAIKNYMSHRDTTVDLHPITVLVGGNGGGKSAFFDALLNFSMVSRGRLSAAFSPGPYSFQYLRSHGAGPNARVAYQIEIAEDSEADESIRYEISYGQNNDSYIIYKETIQDANGVVLFDRDDADAYPMGSAHNYLSDDRSILAAIRQSRMAGGYDETNPLITLLAKDVSRIFKFRLDPSNLARPSRLPEISAAEEEQRDIPRLSYRGEDLASVLYFLSESLSPLAAEIVDHCREVIPAFGGFEFNSVGTDKIGFSVIFLDERGSVPAANLSDGTLICIGLVALLLSRDGRPVICIEETENGLTPTVIKKAYALIRSLASGELGNSHAQVLISSHSPYVVREAWNGDDRDFIYQMRSDQGSSVVRKFSDVIDQDEIMLGMDSSRKRTKLSLSNIEEIMDGYHVGR